MQRNSAAASFVPDGICGVDLPDQFLNRKGAKTQRAVQK